MDRCRGRRNWCLHRCFWSCSTRSRPAGCRRRGGKRELEDFALPQSDQVDKERLEQGRRESKRSERQEILSDAGNECKGHKVICEAAGNKRRSNPTRPALLESNPLDKERRQ